jgi:hypothetical protein
MASTKLTRTPGSAGNRKTWTFSAWIKKGKVSAEQGLLWSNPDTNNHTAIRFTSADELRCLHVASGSTGNGFDKKTNRLFRDVNAWYHIVVAVDTTLSTATDRVKFYVNGVQETSFATDTFGASQNLDTYINSTELQEIGNENSAQYFDGSMAHVHLTDGTAYAASTFGETDSTSGIWKPKTGPSVTYGTNGFFLRFQDSSSLGDDSSGNTNDFTLSGSGKQILDTPSNVFNTLNPLNTPPGANAFNLSNGNTTMGDNGSGDNDLGMTGTLGMAAGKWYWEVKAVNAGETLCIVDSTARIVASATDGTPNAGFWGVQSNGSGSSINTYSNGTFGNSHTLQGHDNNDIVMFALDIDNGKFFYGRNGSWLGLDGNAANPAAGTNAIFTNIPTSGTTFLTFTEHRSSGNPATHWNWGNGYFGTTAVSSAENDGAGYGKFEYTVPTGFYALCTKNINTYG